MTNRPEYSSLNGLPTRPAAHRPFFGGAKRIAFDDVLLPASVSPQLRTVDRFSGWMRDATSEAGLPLDCKPRGRKAAGRLLAEASAASKMIMSILGRTTLAEAERYCEEAEQAGLAVAAVIELEAPKTNKHSQTTFWEFAENRQKKRKTR